MPVKPIVRTIANALPLVLGLWGALITDAELFLFLAISVLGIINLIFSVKEEGEKEKAKREAAEDRERLNVFIDRLGHQYIPGSLQNFEHTSNADLKGMIAKESEAARLFERDRMSKLISAILLSKPLPSMSEDAKRLVWERNRETENRQRWEFEADFVKDHRPALKALWDEVERRTEGFERYEVWQASAILEGSLVGASPIESAVSILEAKARTLPDD